MPSLSLKKWQPERQEWLDEIERAHARIEGTARGRRYATQKVNHAYAVLLSSEFQGFCRDLHSESVNALVSVIAPNSLQPIIRAALTLNRKLDHGNPNPGNLGDDFGRLGIAKFWDVVRSADAKSTRRQARLEELNAWRNAIAISSSILQGSEARRRSGSTKFAPSGALCEGLR